MAVLHYWWLVLKRAWSDTTQAVGRNPRALLLSPLLFAIGLGIYWQTVGFQKAMDRLTLAVDFFAPFGVLLVVLYGWNLIRAPFRMAQERAAHWDRRIAEADSELARLRARVLEYQTPRLELVFECGDRRRNQSEGGTGVNDGQEIGLLYRAKVVNPTGRTIRGVRVFIDFCEPEDAPFYPVPLRVMNDDLPFPRTVDGFKLLIPA